MIDLGMSKQNRCRALSGALGVALVLTACGDLGMVLPSQGSYRVNAQVDGDYTLDAYSVVTKNSTIRPYFVNSVVNDPDVRGLTVFVQDYSGTVVSRKVQYQLVVEAEKPAPEPTPPAAATPPKLPAETAPLKTPDAPAAEAGPADAVDEVPPDDVSNDAAPNDEPPEGEAVLPGGTAALDPETDPRADTPDAREEEPRELPVAGFDDPVAEAAAGFPGKAPADSFGGGKAETSGAAVDAARSETNSPDTAREAEDTDATPTNATAIGSTNTTAANAGAVNSSGATNANVNNTNAVNSSGATPTNATAIGSTNTTAANAGAANSAGATNTTAANAGAENSSGATNNATNANTKDANANSTNAANSSGATNNATNANTTNANATNANATNANATNANATNANANNTSANNAGAINSSGATNNATNSNATNTNANNTNANNTNAANSSGATNTNATNTNATNTNATNTTATNNVGAATAKNTDSAATDTVDADTADADSAVTAGTDTAGPAAAPVETLPAETPKPAAKPPIPEDEIVPVKQLDQYFPAFRIVEALDIGRYNLVFQVMGEKEILYRTFRPIYFLGDATFSLGEIQSFLPVAVTGGRLIPPGINVMLEIDIRADSRLDPHVLWYNNKKIIAQGRLSEGANSLLWKTPEQTGFHSIRAEVFPLLPGERMPGNMIGKIKELSLPVSAKSEGIRRFNDSGGEFISWYQFWGTLDDAKALGNPERRLVSLSSQSPRWIPFGGMYGLLVGRDDGYALPGAPFKLSRDEQGTGRIWFHLAALSEGAIVTIRFAGGESSPSLASPPVGAAQTGAREDGLLGAAELDLRFAGDALTLWIASGDASREESLTLGEEANGFITVMVEFAIAPDRLDAELRLENPAGTTGPLSIALAAPISGEGVIRFGGADYAGSRQSLSRPASGQSGKYGGGTMALNELALSYARLPVPPREEEPDVSENVLAEEAEQGAEPASRKAL
jgi:hypothetical protein